MLIFGRSPLAWIALVQTVLAFVVTIPSLGITPTVAAATVVILSGVATIADAVLARPVATAAIAGAFRTILIAAGAFGLTLSEGTLTALVALVAFVVAFITQPNTTPTGDPAEGFDTRS